MRYLDSIKDFFKSPKWGMNMLLGAVCILIPIVGPLVIAGWSITQFWSRDDDNQDPSLLPPFDFQYFGKYLERGLWPFLVQLVASIVTMPLTFALMIPILALPSSRGHGHSDGGNILLVGLFVAFFIAYLIFIIGLQLAMTPLNIRATLTQNFASAFNFRFICDFSKLAWKETILSLLFLMAVGLIMAPIGIITCYLGFFACIPVVTFSWYHLQKQLYQLYLQRGGNPVEKSHKLTDQPPSFPA